MGLPNDSLLTNIGSLFRKSGYDSWLITVNYSRGRGEGDKQGIKFSNAPTLCRGRMYSNGYDGSRKGPIFAFTIDDLASWYDAEYFYAKYFESSSPITLSSVGARKISAVCRIPKFELARVLFFYNTYLATSSLQERALDLSFKTSFVDGRHQIEVLPHCPVPAKSFSNEILRNHLAWLLLNHEVRRSYESIYQHLLEEKTYKGDYTNWSFNFTPPPLKNIKINARFYIDKNGVYRVDEILSITNLLSDIDSRVEFIGEHFVDRRQSTNPNATEIPIKPLENDSGHVIDDNSDANIDTNEQVISMPQVALQFRDPVASTINYTETKSYTTPKLVNEPDIDNDSEPNETIVATDEATIFGDVPKGEFQNIRDISDQMVNNSIDFEAIIRLLHSFNTKHLIDDLTIQYHELPKVRYCRRHRTRDGRPRLMMEAKLKYAYQSFSIFEVHTADIDKRLSTLIVKVGSDTKLDHKISEFMTNVVKGSISWTDAAPLLGDYETLNHPTNFYEKECDKRMLQKWLDGLEKAVEKLSDT